MKQLSIFAAVVVSIFLLTGVALADEIATQNVTFQVMAINEIEVSGAPSLTIDTATAGQQPDSVTDNSARYSFTTNQPARKITGELTALGGGNMPQHTTLEINLSTDGIGGGWTSAGFKALSTTPVTLATGGERTAESKTITYRFSATVDAGVMNGSREVTLTLTAE